MRKAVKLFIIFIDVFIYIVNVKLFSSCCCRRRRRRCCYIPCITGTFNKIEPPRGEPPTDPPTTTREVWEEFKQVLPTEREANYIRTYNKKDEKIHDPWVPPFLKKAVLKEIDNDDDDDDDDDDDRS